MAIIDIRRLRRGGVRFALFAVLATATMESHSAAPVAAQVPPDVSAHANMGSLERPEPVPSIILMQENGRRITLAHLLRGHTTALQFVFTTCSDTCPIQGANFARVLAEAHSVNRDSGATTLQLLSVTIAPQVDGPDEMRRWRRRWSNDPRWQGLVTTPADLAQLQVFLKGRGEPGGNHSTQVFLFDRQARLVYRSREWPRPDEIRSLMNRWNSV